MADFGFGPYAWLREPSERLPYVGSCIADVLSGFAGEVPVSSELEHEFSLWVTQFERNYDNDAFGWEPWNNMGIGLTKHLRAEMGDLFDFEYHYPLEDPQNGGGILSLADR